MVDIGGLTQGASDAMRPWTYLTGMLCHILAGTASSEVSKYNQSILLLAQNFM